MTQPADPDTPQPGALSALTDPDNVGWEEIEDPQEINDTEAYWRLRGMVAPARTEPVE